MYCVCRRSHANLPKSLQYCVVSRIFRPRCCGCVSSSFLLSCITLHRAVCLSVYILYHITSWCLSLYVHTVSHYITSLPACLPVCLSVCLSVHCTVLSELAVKRSQSSLRLHNLSTSLLPRKLQSMRCVHKSLFVIFLYLFIYFYFIFIFIFLFSSI